MTSTDTITYITGVYLVTQMHCPSLQICETTDSHPTTVLLFLLSHDSVTPEVVKLCLIHHIFHFLF